MSGGYYNYLYSQEPTTPYGYRMMVERFTELGHLDVAGKLRALITHLEAAAKIHEELKEPMHALEWLDSCDYAPDQFAEEMKEWKDKKQ